MLFDVFPVRAQQYLFVIDCSCGSEAKMHLKQLSTFWNAVYQPYFYLSLLIKNLSKKIKAEKFAQTKGGKVFNAIGDFGLAVGKKVLTPPKNSNVKQAVKKKAKKSMDINQIIKNLPQ